MTITKVQNKLPPSRLMQRAPVQVRERGRAQQRRRLRRRRLQVQADVQEGVVRGGRVPALAARHVRAQQPAKHNLARRQGSRVQRAVSETATT